jgi:glyoxylase-like metal-dependent hydrolase (beta-lactamase superfamily II)
VQRGTGASIYVHSLDAPYLDGREPPLLPRGRRGQLMAALGRVVDLCPTVFRLEPLTPHVPLGDLVPLATPGHTPGHVCLFHRRDGALLTGDAIVVDGSEPALPAASLSHDPARARTSLQGLRDVPFLHLFPGHGAPLLDDGTLARRIEQLV